MELHVVGKDFQSRKGYKLPGFDSKRRLGIFLFNTVSTTALGPRGPFPGGKAARA